MSQYYAGNSNFNFFWQNSDRRRIVGGSNNAIGYFGDDKPPIEQTAYFT
jgi:hypothetical protein